MENMILENCRKNLTRFSTMTDVEIYNWMCDNFYTKDYEMVRKCSRIIFDESRQIQIFMKGSEIVDKEYTTLKAPFMLIFEVGKSTEIIFLETEEELIEMGKEINKRGGKVIEAMEIASCRKIEI